MIKYYAAILCLLLPSICFASVDLEKNKNCPDYFSLLSKSFEKKMVDGQERLVFTEDGRKAFSITRSNLRHNVQKLNSKFYEYDHAIKRIYQAMMMGAPVFIYGPPGGAKSDVARNILYALITQSDGTIKADVFAIQLHQLVTELSFKGFIDFDKTAKLHSEIDKAAKILEITKNDVVFEGSMIAFAFALLDEFDKGNPMAYSALLEILNEKIAQHGPITLKSRTRTTVATSNKTPAEVVYLLKRQGQETTADALLDRFLFKVYAANHMANQINLVDLLQTKEREKRLKSEDRLVTNYTKRSHASDGVMELDSFESELLEVNWEWLEDLMHYGVSFKRVVLSEIMLFLKKLEEKSVTYYREVERQVHDDAGRKDSRNLYYPASGFSNRSIGYATEVIASSIMYELLIIPSEVLSDDDLISMLEEGIDVNYLSLFRLQDMYITAAPGEPRLVLKNDADGDPLSFYPSLEYGMGLDTLLKRVYPTDRETDMLKHINQERSFVQSIYAKRLEEVHTKGKSKDDLDEDDEISTEQVSSSDNVEKLIYEANKK